MLIQKISFLQVKYSTKTVFNFGKVDSSKAGVVGLHDETMNSNSHILLKSIEAIAKGIVNQLRTPSIIFYSYLTSHCYDTSDTKQYMKCHITLHARVYSALLYQILINHEVHDEHLQKHFITNR